MLFSSILKKIVGTLQELLLCGQVYVVLSFIGKERAVGGKTLPKYHMQALLCFVNYVDL